MKIFFITLGCKVNQYETQSMKESLLESGFCCADSIESADIIIFNSCTVTSVSDHKMNKLINRAKRQNNKAIIILTGCMPQAFPDVACQLSNVNIVLGNSNRSELCISIKKFLKDNKKIINVKKYSVNNKFDTPIIKKFNNRTRAFIKIEDGCNRFCSYCIIPYARGHVRSKSLDNIILEANQLANANYKELVLVGINLSAYGSDSSSTLYDVVEAISSVDGIERIRLGSLEPEKLEIDTIKKLARQNKLCPQFHLSLQSGCDNTLKRMNRHYLSHDYLKIVNDLRENFDNPSITTDIMIGFPGETDQDFQESLEFVKKVSFSKMHVFSYSKRPGTKAFEMDNQVSENEKVKRNKIMSNTEFKMRQNFLLSQINKVHSVLFETSIKNGFYEGYTLNYVPVKIRSNFDLRNMIVDMKLESLNKTKNELFLTGRGEGYDLIL